MSNHLLSKIGVGALIIDPENDSVLLCKKNYGFTKDKWTFPEGYVDKDESLSEALRREVKEELNGSIEINDLIAVRQKTDENPTMYFVFNCVLLNKDKLKINDKEEIGEFKFLKVSEIKENEEVYSLVKVILEKHKEGLKRIDFSPKEMDIDKDNYRLYL